MDELFTIGGVDGNSIETFLSHHQFWVNKPDVFLHLLSFALDTNGVITHTAVVRPRTSWRTVVRNKTNFLEALGMFFQLFTSGELPRSEIMSNWRPRFRAAAYGTLFPNATFSRVRIGDLQSFTDPTLNEVRVALYSGGFGTYISADGFFDFALALYKAKGDQFTTKRFVDLHAGEYGYVWLGQPSYIECSYTLSNVGRDVLHYSVVEDLMVNPSIGLRTEYTMKVRRSLNNSQTLTFETSGGFLGWRYPPDPTTYWYDRYTVRPGVVVQAVNQVRIDGRNDVLNLEESIPVSISGSAAALYHTQSRAYYNLCGKVTRNFESLMEAPGFLPLIWEAALSIPALRSLGSGLSIFGRVRALTKLLSGVYLAYIFAVAPALKSARDVYDAFMETVKETDGEGTLVFEGDADSYTALPSGLRSLLDACHPAPISRFHIRFRTQMTLKMTRPRANGVIDSLISDAERAGVEPNPVYIYQAVPFSFVFDQFFPLGGLIQDAYQRYKLIGMRGVTVGHSVSVTLDYATGYSVHVYIRSDATDRYFDPPLDSWLTAPGAALPVLVPLALAQVL